MITEDEWESKEKTLELLEAESEYGMSIYDDYLGEVEIVENMR